MPVPTGEMTVMGYGTQGRLWNRKKRKSRVVLIIILAILRDMTKLDCWMGARLRIQKPALETEFKYHGKRRGS